MADPLNTTANITNVSSKVLLGNSARTMVTFVNSGLNNIYISKGIDAVSGSGILLQPGGAHTMYATGDKAQVGIFRGDIYACTDISTSQLSICEEYS